MTISVATFCALDGPMHANHLNIMMAHMRDCVGELTGCCGPAQAHQ